jgi:hypothetical protein
MTSRIHLKTVRCDYGQDKDSVAVSELPNENDLICDIQQLDFVSLEDVVVEVNLLCRGG